jgi:hypothetical protein
MGIHLSKTGVSDSHFFFARWLRRTRMSPACLYRMPDPGKIRAFSNLAVVHIETKKRLLTK